MISHRKSFEKKLLFGEKLLHYVDQKPVFSLQNLNAARRDKACAGSFEELIEANRFKGSGWALAL
jgi:hypothetical protein